MRHPLGLCRLIKTAKTNNRRIFSEIIPKSNKLYENNLYCRFNEQIRCYNMYESVYYFKINIYLHISFVRCSLGITTTNIFINLYL